LRIRQAWCRADVLGRETTGVVHQVLLSAVISACASRLHMRSSSVSTTFTACAPLEKRVDQPRGILNLWRVSKFFEGDELGSAHPAFAR
jgi:hypothetical protein